MGLSNDMDLFYFLYLNLPNKTLSIPQIFCIGHNYYNKSIKPHEYCAEELNDKGTTLS